MGLHAQQPLTVVVYPPPSDPSVAFSLSPVVSRIREWLLHQPQYILEQQQQRSSPLLLLLLQQQQQPDLQRKSMLVDGLGCIRRLANRQVRCFAAAAAAAAITIAAVADVPAADCPTAAAARRQRQQLSMYHRLS